MLRDNSRLALVCGVVVTLFVLVAIPVAAFTDCGTAAEYTILEGDSWVRSYCPRGETYSLKADQLVPLFFLSAIIGEIVFVAIDWFSRRRDQGPSRPSGD